MSRKSTEERRDEVVNALLTVMADQGYAKATINRIASEAGLTAGLIHYHFKSKQEILLELLDRIISGQLAIVDDEWANDNLSDWDRVQVFIRHYLQTGEHADMDRVAAWVTITAEAIRQPEVGEAFHVAIRNMADRLSGVIDDGVAGGEFELAADITSEAASAAITSLIQGYFNLGVTVREVIPRGTAAPAAIEMARGLLNPRS